jgi:hypothetical protein
MDLLPHIVDAEATGLLTLMERRLCIPHDEYKVSLRKIHEKICQALRAFTCCTSDRFNDH